MRNQFFIIVFLFAAFLFSTGCEEYTSPDQGIIVEGIPKDTTILVNTVFDLELKVKAGDGLDLFRIAVNGIDVQSRKFSGETNFITTFSYTPNSLEAGKQIIIVVFARDSDGDIFDSKILLNIIDGVKPIAENPPTIIDNPLVSQILVVKEDICTDQTWYSGNTYILDGRIAVKCGAKLTIQKGVIVKANLPIGEKISSLIITPGAKIDAQGTESQPIIFTSIKDLIQPGTIEPKLNEGFFDESWWDEGRKPDYQGQYGLWGGLLILGKARGSFPGSVSEYQIVGIPESDQKGKYGGNDDLDNSGILRNISIRYAGNKLFSNQNISALTLGAVGLGTIIENIEIYQCAADGIRIFGGTVNLKNILTALNADDGISIDQGWNGTLENFLMLGNGDNSFEIDGPKGSYYNGNHSILNGAVMSWTSKSLIFFEEGSNTDISNTYFFDLDEDLKFGINMLPTRYSPKISGIEVSLINKNSSISHLFDGWNEDQVKLVRPEQRTVGPDLSGFENWSWVLSFFIVNGFSL